MTKTTRPAIVIGLGYTGQTVLTYVKQMVGDTHSRAPNTLRLLVFARRGQHPEETTATEPPAASHLTSRLEELVSTGGSVEAVRAGPEREAKRPHTHHRTQTEYYLKDIDDDHGRPAKGIGHSQRFGRAADFFGLGSGRLRTMKAIQQAVADVKSAGQVEEPLEIHIVCSLSGGTGTGILIDIAHMARQVAERETIPSNIRGWIVLQGISKARVKAQHVLPGVHATMRELQRYMKLFDQEHRPNHSHDAGEPREIHQRIYECSLFDACYLVESEQPWLPPDDMESHRLLLETVAQGITAFLDAGTNKTLTTPYGTDGNGP
jgi:hypothetical protein